MATLEDEIECLRLIAWRKPLAKRPAGRRFDEEIVKRLANVKVLAHPKSLSNVDLKKGRLGEEELNRVRNLERCVQHMGGGFGKPARRPKSFRLPPAIDGEHDRTRWGEKVTSYLEQIYQTQI